MTGRWTCSRSPSPLQLALVTFYKTSCLNLASTRQWRFCFPSSQMKALWLQKMKKPAQSQQGNRWQSRALRSKSMWASLVAQMVTNAPPILGLGRSPGEGNGDPLQYSGLENSMDCIVPGVAKSRTQLSDFRLHFHFQSLVASQGVWLDRMVRDLGPIRDLGPLEAAGALQGVGKLYPQTKTRHTCTQTHRSAGFISNYILHAHCHGNTVKQRSIITTFYLFFKFHF